MRNRGYTLLELLFVVGLSGSLLAGGAWAFVGIRDSWILSNEVAMLAALLEEARTRAVLANTSVRVTVAGGTVTVQDAGSQPRSIPLSPGVSFSGNSISILFSSRGTASPGTSWTLAYRSRRAVLVVAPAGRVRTLL